jgi:hypothetical protein
MYSILMVELNAGVVQGRPDPADRLQNPESSAGCRVGLGGVFAAPDALLRVKRQSVICSDVAR